MMHYKRDEMQNQLLIMPKTLQNVLFTEIKRRRRTDGAPGLVCSADLYGDHSRGKGHVSGGVNENEQVFIHLDGPFR